ncbi:leucyl aminopeptidase [Leucobacter luti]|uniref:Probable cytosol aminopeptidase n=1 Tax=Leucobacter luti TaxID=340320 RepID=A0A4R6RSG7_9MICO|nr:M17 family metallopeptidase [Leucobacter luti]TDP89819.1 leucyl aminopeptidase [Leucobacter luti]
MTADTGTVHYLLLPSLPAPGGAATAESPELASGLAAGRAALAVALFASDDAARADLAAAEAQLVACLDAGGVARNAGSAAAGGAARFVILTAAGPRTVVACHVPARRTGPGAPGDLERLAEAGWRFGAAAPGGTLYWPAGSRVGDALPREDADEWGGLRDAQREALWHGAVLGGADPAEGDSSEHAARAVRPIFGDGAVVSDRAQRQAAAVAWVRRLTERPPNLLGPAELAAEISALAEGAGVQCEVWAGDELASRGFGATIGVGSGSERAPRVVRLTWGSDAAAAATLGLVGKGITFDSGGLNVKQDSSEMSWMKADMAAAAALSAALVLSAQATGADLADGRRVEAILPLCENVISGTAQRPGDVVTHPGGATSEVVDTDCEGRLVLADGIAWCRERGHAVILDAGTLTDGGAGLRASGVWSNHEGLARAVEHAGRVALDPVWPIPLPYGEESALESRVAGVRNAPLDRPDMGRHAASYLGGFAGDVPWVHIDLGGTAFLEAPLAGRPEGATGAGTLVSAEVAEAWLRGAPLIA